MKKADLDKPLLAFLCEDLTASDKTKSRVFGHTDAATLRDLCRLTRAQLGKCRRIDITVFRELTDGLAEFGLALGMTDGELEAYQPMQAAEVVEPTEPTKDIIEELREAIAPLLAVLFPEEARRARA